MCVASPAFERDVGRAGQQDHQTYFPALAKLASDRHEATFDNWQKMANGKIGFSERLTRPPYDVPVISNGHEKGVEEKLAAMQLEAEPAVQAQA